MIRYETKSGNKIFVLIGILLSIFLITKLPIQFGSPDIKYSWAIFLSYIYMPADFITFLQHFWTIATQVFLSYNFSQFILSISSLYLFGTLFNGFYGRKNLFKIFFAGGISGGILYLIMFSIIPELSKYPQNLFISGSMSGVLSLATACTLFSPNYKIPLMLIGNIRLKYVFLIFLLFDGLNIYPSTMSWHIVDIGGILLGSFYFLFTKYPDLLTFTLKKKNQSFKRKKEPEFTYSYKKPVSDDEYNKLKVEKQKKIDAILDKISQKGYDSLTKDEKDFLFNSTRKGNTE